MKNKNVLVLYSSFGSSSKVSAIALEEKIKTLYPGVSISLFDPFNYSKPFNNKMIIFFSTFFASKFKKLKYKFHNNKINPDYAKKEDIYYAKAMSFWSYKLEQKLLDINPDIIFSTNASATNLIAFNKDKIKATLISVFTDYGFKTDAIIKHDNVDYYAVPSIGVKKKLISLGVLPNKIHVTGIPLRNQFDDIIFETDSVFEKYHLSKQKPLFLFISGGGIGHENGFTYFEALLKSKLNFSYLFISGSNKMLEEKAKSIAVKHGKSGKVLGYINNMAEIINACDLVIGKAGGILLSECLTLGVPFYSVEPIPGSEMWNSTFIQKNEFGYYAKNIKEFNSFLRKLHNKSISLSKLRRNITKEYQHDTFIEFLRNIN